MIAYLVRFRPTITVLSGEAAGMEFVVESRRSLIGRGPGVDLALDDASLAREHAALELSDAGVELRALPAASARLNGAPVRSAKLKPGDRFSLGAISFGFEIEPRGEGAER
jgi:pSer/pThr/pTyr-binding forkhead associated (FHA) protein